ncbi:MAG: FAD:protein FMN transferase [Muribaculaceae bacterium]|nr:FAD:protein FMN transferase [Muribaculaceae bacterium]
MRLKHLYLSVITFVIFLLISAAGCQRPAPARLMQGMIWNTTFRITYLSEHDLNDSVMAALNEVGNSLSVFDTTSLVSRVNRSKDAVVVDSAFCVVWREAMATHRASHGRFDPTLSPLITAWGFGPGHRPTADTLRIDSLLRIVGITKSHLRGDTLYKDIAALQFNFSALAKGFGCDMAAAVLKRNGVKDFLVEIGGEIAAEGNSPRGTSWRVSVDKPVTSDEVMHTSQLIVNLPTPCGLATSGNYRNFHTTASGSRFGHTIDPVSGRPCLTDVLSATVIAPTCMQADALATACMTMSSQSAMSMADSLGRPVMLILADSTVCMSPSFSALVKDTP